VRLLSRFSGYYNSLEALDWWGRTLILQAFMQPCDAEAKHLLGGLVSCHMRIKSTDVIGGIEAVAVRRLLRHTPDREWTLAYAVQSLKISQKRTKTLLDELVKQGSLEIKQAAREKVFLTTTKGLALGSATAAAPIGRAKADSVMGEFLKRVELGNASSHYLYRVKTAVIFGSYVTTDGAVGDIDIAIALEQKSIPNWMEAAKKYSKDAEAAGRRFRSFIEFLCWPEIDVRQFLKGRSRVLSLMEFSSHRDILLKTPHRVIVGSFP
jgi:predicted nucleotidyltransferase